MLRIPSTTTPAVAKRVVLSHLRAVGTLPSTHPVSLDGVSARRHITVRVGGNLSIFNTLKALKSFNDKLEAQRTDEYYKKNRYFVKPKDRRRLNASNAIYYQHKKEVEKEFMNALLEPDIAQEFGIPEPDMFQADEGTDEAQNPQQQQQQQRRGGGGGRGGGGDSSGF